MGGNPCFITKDILEYYKPSENPKKSKKGCSFEASSSEVPRARVRVSRRPRAARRPRGGSQAAACKAVSRKKTEKKKTNQPHILTHDFILPTSYSNPPLLPNSIPFLNQNPNPTPIYTYIYTYATPITFTSTISNPSFYTQSQISFSSCIHGTKESSCFYCCCE